MARLFRSGKATRAVITVSMLRGPPRIDAERRAGYRTAWSERQVQPQSVVERFNERPAEVPNDGSEPFDVHRPDLLGLRLRVARQSGLAGSEQHLERMDAIDRRGHRNNGDHTPAQTRRHGVRAIVGDDDRRSALVGLRSASRIEVHETDLAAHHSREPRPSATVASQASASSVAQVSQASA